MSERVRHDAPAWSASTVPCAFCEARYIEDANAPRVIATHPDNGRRFVVGACVDARCRDLLREMQSELTAAMERGRIDDLPGFLRALQLRLLGRGAQA